MPCWEVMSTHNSETEQYTLLVDPQRQLEVTLGPHSKTHLPVS